jgi:hypothetical protein
MLNHMVKLASVMNVVPRTPRYSMKLMTCIRPFGTTYKRLHVVHVIAL